MRWQLPDVSTAFNVTTAGFVTLPSLCGAVVGRFDYAQRDGDVVDYFTEPMRGSCRTF